MTLYSSIRTAIKYLYNKNIYHICEYLHIYRVLKLERFILIYKKYWYLPKFNTLSKQSFCRTTGISSV